MPYSIDDHFQIFHNLYPNGIHSLFPEYSEIRHTFYLFFSLYTYWSISVSRLVIRSTRANGMESFKSYTSNVISYL